MCPHILLVLLFTLLYGPPFHTIVLLPSFCFYFDKPQFLPILLFDCTILVPIFISYELLFPAHTFSHLQIYSALTCSVSLLRS